MLFKVFMDKPVIPYILHVISSWHYFLFSLHIRLFLFNGITSLSFIGIAVGNSWRICPHTKIGEIDK